MEWTVLFSFVLNANDVKPTPVKVKFATRQSCVTAIARFGFKFKPDEYLGACKAFKESEVMHIGQEELISITRK